MAAQPTPAPAPAPPRTPSPTRAAAPAPGTGPVRTARALLFVAALGKSVFLVFGLFLLTALTAWFGGAFLSDPGPVAAGPLPAAAPLQEGPEVNEETTPIGIWGILTILGLLLGVVGLIACPVLDWLALRAIRNGRTPRAGTLAITSGILSILPFVIYFLFGVLSIIAGVILAAQREDPDGTRTPGPRKGPRTAEA